MITDFKSLGFLPLRRLLQYNRRLQPLAIQWLVFEKEEKMHKGRCVYVWVPASRTRSTICGSSARRRSHTVLTPSGCRSIPLDRWVQDRDHDHPLLISPRFCGSWDRFQPLPNSDPRLDIGRGSCSQSLERRGEGEPISTMMDLDSRVDAEDPEKVIPVEELPFEALDINNLLQEEDAESVRTGRSEQGCSWSDL